LAATKMICSSEVPGTTSSRHPEHVNHRGHQDEAAADAENCAKHADHKAEADRNRALM